MENIFTVNSSSDWLLPPKSCLINFSYLKEIHCKAPFRSFSIKYVCDGKERYQVNDNHYNIESGQYLLANHFAEGVVEIHQPVRGICIDIAPAVLSEVAGSYMRPDTPFADENLDVYFNSPDFLDNKYAHNQTYLGRFLKAFDAEIMKDPTHNWRFSKEFYFSLAEKVVEDYIPILKQLQAIPSIKLLTRKDLYRRVGKGKAFMDANGFASLDIKRVAMECQMSEYHFFRTFKQVYGVSPYQYVLHNRLQFAHDLLKDPQLQISDIALMVGFADVFAFSKAFKQFYGLSPLHWKKKNQH